MQYFQPREGKHAAKRARRIPQAFTSCAGCNKFAHCMERNKAMLCLECRSEPVEP